MRREENVVDKLIPYGHVGRVDPDITHVFYALAELYELLDKRSPQPIKQCKHNPSLLNRICPHVVQCEQCMELLIDFIETVE